MGKSYKDLEVYRRAFALLKPVHDLVLGFPDYEKYDICNQMRRAAKSVPSLIAEGYARNRSPKEFCSYLSQALGSANEMEVHFDVARELGYIGQRDYEHFIEEYQIVGKQLTRLIQYWRSRDNPSMQHQSPVTIHQSPGDQQ